MRVHDIDVTARMSIGRMTHSVPRGRVLNLLGIVSDVGVDGGLMLSECDFQAGAIRTSSNSKAPAPLR